MALVTSQVMILPSLISPPQSTTNHPLFPLLLCYSFPSVHGLYQYHFFITFVFEFFTSAFFPLFLSSFGSSLPSFPSHSHPSSPSPSLNALPPSPTSPPFTSLNLSLLSLPLSPPPLFSSPFPLPTPRPFLLLLHYLPTVILAKPYFLFILLG